MDELSGGDRINALAQARGEVAALQVKVDGLQTQVRFTTVVFPLKLII